MKLHKPETNAIMDKKEIPEQAYLDTVKPEYNNGGKRIAGSLRD